MPWVRKALLILFILLFAFAVYAAVTVTRGYLASPGVVARALASRPQTLQADSLPAGYLEILLAVEDPAFTTHHGIDFWTPGAGYTTITQALVKALFFEHFTPGLLKIHQSFLAVGLDEHIDKQTQLTLFLNSVYMGTRPGGREVHGLDAAAREYFRKGFASLKRDEYLALVAMIVGPDAFSVATAPGRNAERVRRIQRLLDGVCRPRSFQDVYYEDCVGEGPRVRPGRPVG